MQVMYNQILEQTHYLEQTLNWIIQHNFRVSFPAINNINMLYVILSKNKLIYFIFILIII